MTTAPTPDLRALSNAVKAWACCNEAWPHAEHFDVAVVGGITDGEQYPVAQIDADTYGTDGESLKLAQFYAAANPGAVLALLDRIDALQAENEHLFAQVHKLEMDALDLASENSILKRQDSELEARKPLPWAPQFDAMAPGQEELAIQFCAEIAGPRGKPGRSPDPVRLLEMAEALYQAEFRDHQQTRHAPTQQEIHHA